MGLWLHEIGSCSLGKTDLKWSIRVPGFHLVLVACLVLGFHDLSFLSCLLSFDF